MNLAEINALRAMTWQQLYDFVAANRLDLGDFPHSFPTKDALRLAIIDAVCDREVAEIDRLRRLGARAKGRLQDDAREDHDEPCDCGHGYERHVGEECPGLTVPVAGACEAPGCGCQQYAANEAEAMR